RRAVALLSEEEDVPSARFERWARDMRRTGGFEPGLPNVREGASGGLEQGSEIEFLLKIRDGVIERARYRYRGGPWTGAACAYYADWLEGRPARADAVPPGRVVAEFLGYPRVRYDEALLVEDAIIQALGNEDRNECRTSGGS
ncbi:scaffold protein, partial [mine drainage metagenome]